MYMYIYTYTQHIYAIYAYIHVCVGVYIYIYICIYKLCIYTHKAYLRSADLGFKTTKRVTLQSPYVIFFLLMIVHSWMLFVEENVSLLAPHISQKQPPESFECISSNLNLLSIISLSAHVYAAIAWYWRCNCELCLVIGCTIRFSFSFSVCLFVFFFFLKCSCWHC